jgi:hypothetical protein
MNIFDPLITGSLSVSGSGEISGDLTVLGKINATISGTTTNALTASEAPKYTLTSSFGEFTSSYTTGSFTGSFGGDGSNLTNIPASGVTGLNLTRIADGSVTASISSVDGLRVNTNTEITGALTISGSITLNGVPVGTGKLDEVVFNAYSSSNNTTNSLQNGRLDALEVSTSSLNTFTSSATSRLNTIESTTGSLNTFTSSTNTRLDVFESTTASLNSFTSSTNGRLISLESASSSIRTDFNSFTSSNNIIESTQNSRLNSIEGVTGSIALLNTYTGSNNTVIGALQTSTSSLNTFTSSANGRLNSLESATSSIRSDFSSYTSSNNTVNDTQNNRLNSIESTTGSLNTYTSSNNTRLGVIETTTGSLNTYTSSNNTRLGVIEATTGSLNSYTSSNNTVIGTLQTSTSSLNSYTGSNNTNINAIHTATSSLNSHTSSTNTRLTSIETSTSSLNTFTSSANGRLNSLESASGSIRTDFNSYTSSNNAINTTQNGRLTSLENVTGSYATTGSNVFKGDQTITGSLFISQNLIVQGSSSLENITASAVSIGTNTIVLNTDSPAFRYAGISVFDSGSTNITASLFYDSLTNQWKFKHVDTGTNDASIMLFGPLGNDIDNAPLLDGNFLTKVENNGHGHHLTTSSIFDNGAKVSINSNSEITGSLTVTGVIRSTTTPLVSGSDQINHNNTTNYVANQHIDHTTVSISPGSGLTGGGTIVATRTLTLDTGSAHFLDGVKKELNTEGVISGSNQLTSSFVQKIGDTMTGDLVIRNTGTFNNIRVYSNDDNTWVEQTKPDGTIVGRIGFDGYSTPTAYQTDFLLSTRASSESGLTTKMAISIGNVLSFQNLSGFTYNGNTVWHSGNDGASSGLDADLLDGSHASAFSPVAGSSSITTVGTITSGVWNGTTIAVANGGTGASTAANARTNLGATTVGGNLFTLTNPSAITFPRINADNTISTLSAADFRTAIGAGTSSTTGTVTSVGGTGTVSGLSLSGTVTSTGNLTLGGTLAVTPSNFSSQTANTFLAAPNGSSGTPTFRTIVAADIPTLNQNTTGNATTATTLQTARTIGGVSFNGSANIDLPGVNTTGNQNTTGNAATASNSSLLNGISVTQIFNNMGDNHPTRTSFDASTPSYNFGFRYVQGSTNGPGTGASQYYSWYIGLGNDYPATGAGSYGAMFAVDRNVTTPYLSVRYNENNSFTSWRKIHAGYADTAGSATTATTAGALTSMNISQFTNNSGYLTSVTNISGTAGSETLATVTGRGASTASQISFTKTDDHAISVGTIRGRAVGTQTGEFIQLFERVNIGGPNGWGASNTAAPQYGLSVFGGANIGYGANGGLSVSGIHYSVRNTASGRGNLSFDTSSGVIGNIHVQNGSGAGNDNSNQAAITFQGSNSSEAQAGIYVLNNSSYGTSMGFATTNSYSTGPQLFMTAGNGGVVNFPRATPTVQGNPMLHAGNYTSYTIPIGGSWAADLTSNGFTRQVGVSYSSGEWAILTNNGQISTLIDGSYFAGEQGGFYSMNSSNQFSSRVGFNRDGSGNASFNASIVPTTNGTLNLGSSSARWNTLFTSDLSLSNGIGDYTIVEGEEKLYLYNNKNNKVYSFVLQEEDPTTATPKRPE